MPMKLNIPANPLVYDTELNDIPKKGLRDLYRVMLLIQKVELKIDELYHEDEMKTPVHLCLGQEAIAAGVCSNLNTEDYVFTNHRGHGHYIAKGGDIKKMVAELYNRETGCSRGRGGSMHLIDVAAGLLGSSSIVAGNIPIATGAALASAIRKDKRVAVTFFGDAAIEEGVVYESVNFAMLKKLPVIFVCENNLYSVFSGLGKRQSHGEIYRRFTGLDIPSFRVDGNNVVDVYRKAKVAVSRARKGEGPTFLECQTYRLRDHGGTSSGADIGYRTQEEVDAWAERCPVKNFENFLLKQKLVTESDVKTITENIDSEVKEAFTFAQNSPFPKEQEVANYLFK
jgi:acetoin:2,6-dichlorophenolindophenol oxidoreductase subunit alpha